MKWSLWRPLSRVSAAAAASLPLHSTLVSLWSPLRPLPTPDILLLRWNQAFLRVTRGGSKQSLVRRGRHSSQSVHFPHWRQGGKPRKIPGR